MSAITLADMKSTLKTYDEAYELLEKTEPFEAVEIDSTSNTSFKFEEGWADETRSADMIDPVSVYLTVNGKEYQFTKEGILQAAGQIGLTSKYLLKSPVNLITPQFDYWFNSGLAESVHKLIVSRGLASAWVRPSIVPFSNLELATSIYDGVQNYYGKETEVLADFKFHNSLQRTDVRFIVTPTLKAIQDTDMVDVPEGSMDVWSAGINLHNSLIGKTQTSIDTYLFRWWCTNGAIEKHPEVGIWNRKVNGQAEESVYDWAFDAVGSVLNGIDTTFEKIQSLVKIEPNVNTSDILKDIYTNNKVPIGLRESITDNVINANKLNMYSIMNAFTSAANNPTLTPDKIEKLMEVGGTMPDMYFDDTKARIFSQGQKAGPEAVNPYAIRVSA